MGSSTSTSQCHGPLREVGSVRNSSLRLCSAENGPNWDRAARNTYRDFGPSKSGQEIRRRPGLDGLERVADKPIVPTPDELFEALIELIGSSPVERLAILSLDNEGYLLGSCCTGLGNLRELPCSYRTIVESALADGATRIVISHNHPSGSATPSREDKAITIQLASLLRAIGIELADHIVVTRSAAFSMKLAGML